jgi:AcrR family transcriptional regulator
VARPQLHSEDAILDAARSVVVERGPRAATVGAIADASDAPTGSIYHRFSSVDELLARLWMRAIRRAQHAILAGNQDDPLEAAVYGALAVYDFCLREPGDALLLSSFRRSDFDSVRLSEPVRAELGRLNDEIDQFFDAVARRIGGAARLDIALLAVRDLPYGAALPHVRDGTRPPRARRARLERAVRALLGEH